jgi:hypothetical protein
MQLSLGVKKLATKTDKGLSFKCWLLPQKMSRHAMQTERKHDLMLGIKRFKKDIINIELPEKAKIQSTPKDINLTFPFGEITRKATVKKNKVTIEMITKITKRRITKEEYPTFRSFCHKVDSAEEEEITWK